MIAHKNYSANEDGRDFIVGDLHGKLDLLQEEMRSVVFDTDVDRLFSVGDLIDRGANSMDCLKLINSPWFHPVIGNHEDMMINGLQDRDIYANWMMNGGGWVEREDITEVIKLACEIELNVPYAITVNTSRGHIGICHAQPPTLDWNDVKAPTDKRLQTMIWGRNWIKDFGVKFVNNISRTYHGHTLVNIPLLRGNVAFIDTGAFYTGNLTMLELTADFNDGGGA